jgi:glycosyl-4,4'-diaponeurosporenoate acyltransferase
MPVVDLAPVVAVALNVAFWVVAHSVSGYVAHRLPVSHLQTDGPLLRIRRFEHDGKLYERVLRVRRWKDHLPEAGDLFTGGLSKRALPSNDLDGIQRFAVETRRAERAHWMSLVPLPLCVLWNPPVGVAVMTAYGLAVNLPFIVVQRFNRARCLGVLDRRPSCDRRRRPPDPAPVAGSSRRARGPIRDARGAPPGGTGRTGRPSSGRRSAGG